LLGVVGQGGCNGLLKDAHRLKPGGQGGLSGVALAQVLEVGWDGHHGIADCLPGPVFELPPEEAKDLGGHVLGRHMELPDPKSEVGRLHLALAVDHHPVRVQLAPRQSRRANHGILAGLPRRREVDHRRDEPLRANLQNLGIHLVIHDGSQAGRGSQVDSYKHPLLLKVQTV
jgi:hypothetical protein